MRGNAIFIIAYFGGFVKKKMVGTCCADYFCALCFYFIIFASYTGFEESTDFQTITFTLVYVAVVVNVSGDSS